MVEQPHNFGGPWTEEKLEKVSSYLRAYTIALRNKPFRLMYVDAFAGTGYRASKQIGEVVRGLFPIPDSDEFARGSARRALDMEPAFDEYIFIEANKGRFAELQKLQDEFRNQRHKMRFRNEDANFAISEVCRSTDWRKARAVMFLDPYGMQVNWETIETIAAAQHVDLWYLFPIGALQRLLTREGTISLEWQTALDRFIGDNSWRSAFYETKSERTLFDNLSRSQKVADLSTIEKFMRGRLQQIFRGGVANKALQLRNSKGSCMFLLFFACGNPNPKAHRLALRIAQHILKS